MCHYLLYTSAWVTGNKAEMGEWKRPGGSSCLHKYPSCQFHSDLWRVFPEQGTNDLHTYLSEEDITGQGFLYHIPLCLQDPLPGFLCLSVCRCVYVCCWVKLTLSRSSGQGGTAGCIPCVCLCGSARSSVYVVTFQSLCIASTMWKADWLCKCPLQWKIAANQIILTRCVLCKGVTIIIQCLDRALMPFTTPLTRRNCYHCSAKNPLY